MNGANNSSENNKNKVNKLEATNQQLNASNQQLRATEQQLRAANQQMLASNQQLKETSAKLQELKQAVEIAVDGIIVTDHEGNTIFANQSWAEMHGMNAEELPGKHISIFHTDEQVKTEVADSMGKLFKEGTWAGEIGHVRRNGSTFPTFMSTSMVKDEEGKPVRMIGVARDITEQKKAETKLLELKQAIETAVDGMILTDIDGNISFANQSWAGMHGMTAEELPGKHISIFHTDEQVKTEVADSMGKLFNEGTWAGEIGHVRRDGTTFPAFMSTAILKDSNGKPVRLIGVARDITEQKRAEKELKDSEEKFKAIFDSVNDGIILADMETRKFYMANNRICHMLGYSLEELKYIGVENIHPEKDLSYVMGEFEKQAKREIEIANDLPVQRKDGSIFYCDVNTSPVTINGGKYLIGIFRDTTERKKAEEALKKSEEKVKAYNQQLTASNQQLNASNQQLKATSAKLLETTQAVETAVDGIAISDLEGNLVFINQAFAGMHGLKAEDLIGKGMGIFHTPEQLASDVQSHLAQMMKKGSANGEVWHVRQDGSTFPTFMSTSIVKDEAGKPVRMIGVARDITEQKKAEEALRIKDGAIESSINAIAIADMQGNLNYVNSAFLKLWGYGTPAEVLGKSVLGFWQMGDKAAEITDAVQVKGGWIGELVAQRKDGSLLDVQISASMVVDPAGRPVCMQGAFIDITERKKAEEALKQSEEKVKAYNQQLTASNQQLRATGQQLTAANQQLNAYNQQLKASEEKIKNYSENLEKLVEQRTVELKKSEAFLEYSMVNAPDGVALVNKEGAFTFANPVFLEWIGYERKDIIGKSTKELLPMILPQKYVEMLRERSERRLKTGEAIIGAEFEIIGKNGKVIPVSYSAGGIKDDKGNVIGEVVFMRDVTERNNLQEKIVTSERLATIGQFSGSIAHELRNPLATIDSSIYFIKEKLQNVDDKVKQHIERIKSSTDNASSIIQSILNLTRMKEPELKKLDIKPVIEESITIAKVPGLVRITQDYAVEQALAHIDKEQMQIAFKNIIRNAAEAMNGEGRLNINVRGIPENKIEISFSDAGPGIAQENLEKVFQPLFTTKTSGIGFGLSISKMVVEKHGGTIRAESKPGNGASIIIQIPASKD